jgi:phosphoglycolate phosphatase-like HAD superfamily hydrolase
VGEDEELSQLVLFDIDGTLCLTGRAGLRGMEAAFLQLHGIENALKDVPFAGRTDYSIVGDALTHWGREASDAEIKRLRDAYVTLLRDELPKPVPDPSGVLPGVEALLDALEGRDDIVVGLLTGNFAGGAELKLGHFDLWRRFRFGAFGDDHRDRRALVPIALDRAREAGLEGCTADRSVIIGDTPLDVDCAHAHGARAIAVATGHYSADELRAAGADLVVETLEDTPAIVGWLGHAPSGSED